MKLLFLLLTLIPPSLLMTDSKSERLAFLSKPCQEATGVPSQMVEDVRKGIYNPDYRMKNNTLCVAKRIGLVSNRGRLIMPALEQRALVATDTTEEGVETTKKCCWHHWRRPEDAAFYCISCLYKTLPLYSNT